MNLRIRWFGPVALLACACSWAQAAGAEKRWPPATPIEGPEPRVNEWVAVEQHGASRRHSAALVYLPKERSWLLAMGTVGAWNDTGPFCYDEQTFDLGRRVWRNRFPPGKEDWGPAVGTCSPPAFRGHGYRIADVEGNPRLGLWEGRFDAYYQYALDTHRHKLVAYVKRHTLEYDPDARTWKDLKPEGDPGAGSRFELWWGSLCYDAHNREFLLFGGNNGGSEFNDTRTWVYSPAANAWRRIEHRTDLLRGLHQKAKALRGQGVALYGACLNRYFKTELPEEAQVRLGEFAGRLATGVAALRHELKGKGAGHERTQCERAAADLETAARFLAAIGGTPSPRSLKAGLALTRALRRAEHGLLGEPPPRAYSPMVYDPATQSIVLFGGDRLDMLYADTWVYDCKTRRWAERRPALSPSPRAGHAFLYLPSSRKLALIGGYQLDSQTGYWGPLYKQLPMQAWTYDVAANQWRLIKEWPLPPRREEIADAAPRYMDRKGTSLPAAADENDVVLVPGPTTRACLLDVSRPDPEGAAERGVEPGTLEWRVGPYDPDWYVEGPAPDEASFQQRLGAVPPNTWTILTPPKEARLPRQNRDWGTAVLDPDRDAIYRWSGGHSAHCGSDIPVFSLRTGRYHLTYPPAFPLGGIGSCGSQPSRSTFLGRPWIPAHSYHSYAYDPVSKTMVCCGHQSLCCTFHPASGTWTLEPLPDAMARDNYYTLTLCSTPAGPYAWTKFGTLFRYDGARGAWAQVQVGGEKLPGTRCDKAGMCHDSKRHRLLLTHAAFEGGLMAVDLETHTARMLSPKRMAVAAKGGHFLREVCYDAGNDALVVATRGERGHKGPLPWPVYGCARDAWIVIEIGGPHCMGVSTGLVYDPKRHLVLAVDANSVVYALKLDLGAARPSAR